MEWDFIIRLCVAGLCGTVIGLDREYRVKDAGFRTHFLVALGSALIMIVSQYGFADILMHTGVGARPQPYRCTGGERHRLHRRRYDHHPPPVGARAYDGGKPLGDGRHRPCGRGAYVCRGCSGYGADALRARSAYAGLWRVGAPQDDGGLFRLRSVLRSTRCSTSCRAANMP